MLVHLRRALTLAGPSEHAARARASLVAAQAFHFVGQFERALPWYQRARHHAGCDGDETTISALMHNMAWLHGSQAREAQLFAGGDDHQLRIAVLGADSTGHFDAGIGTCGSRSIVVRCGLPSHRFRSSPADAKITWMPNSRQASKNWFQPGIISAGQSVVPLQ